MQQTIVIAERFRGPPRSGNGGYVCGVFAELLTQGQHALPHQLAAQVSLRAPVPLDAEMSVHIEGGPTSPQLHVHHGDTLVGEGRLVSLTMDVPDPPSFEQALALRDKSPSFSKQMNPMFAANSVGFHPICFCCGAQHEDGLHVYAGPLPDHSQVAAAWETKAAWANANGEVPASYIWGALDCPGQFAFFAAGIRTGPLGQLTARVVKPIRAGERCVVTGWRMEVEGRKHFAGTAVFDLAGDLCGYAKAIWIGSRPME